jgi:hypothetical protein
MNASIQFHARAALLPGKKYPLANIGPRNQSRRSGQEKNLLPVHSDLEFLYGPS